LALTTTASERTSQSTTNDSMLTRFDTSGRGPLQRSRP
jgi:hypothetical protein